MLYHVVLVAAAVGQSAPLRLLVCCCRVHLPLQPLQQTNQLPTKPHLFLLLLLQIPRPCIASSSSRSNRRLQPMGLGSDKPLQSPKDMQCFTKGAKLLQAKKELH